MSLGDFNSVDYVAKSLSNNAKNYAAMAAISDSNMALQNATAQLKSDVDSNKGIADAFTSGAAIVKDFGKDSKSP
ncbi:hypothetical protein BH10PSE18_BH10PSE18_23400 [soil metagenome]